MDNRTPFDISYTVSWFEIVWVAVSLFGTLDAMRILRIKMGDLAWLIHEGINGDRRTLARSRVRSMKHRAAWSFCFALIGCNAMLLPTSVSSASPFRYGPAILIILMNGSMVLLSRVEYREHQQTARKPYLSESRST